MHLRRGFILSPRMPNPEDHSTRNPRGNGTHLYGPTPPREIVSRITSMERLLQVPLCRREEQGHTNGIKHGSAIYVMQSHLCGHDSIHECVWLGGGDACFFFTRRTCAIVSVFSVSAGMATICAVEPTKLDGCVSPHPCKIGKCVGTSPQKSPLAALSLHTFNSLGETLETGPLDL